MVLAWANLNAQTAQPVPRLVVSIAIDQLRTDYMEAFSTLYGASGFNRLLRDGRSYTDVTYPFAYVDRASAVACLVTGTTPYDNGIVGCRWLERKTLRPVFCVDDPEVQGWNSSAHYSPACLNVSTTADELKVATGGRAMVFSVAPEAETAILGAGHAADAAFWIDDASGQWSGTSYYGSFPDWALRYDSGNRLASRVGDMVWEPMSPIIGSFNFFATPNSDNTFKHKFNGTSRFRDYKSSALVNDEVNRFVQHCLNTTQMGADKVTDYLFVSYYAGTYCRKPVGESAIELEDTYVRLDQKLAELMTMLDKKVGAGRYLLVVTSTGCQETESNELDKYRIPSGTFSISRASSLLNMYLSAIYGTDRYVEAEFGSQLFLNQKLIEDKQLNLSDVLTRSEAFLIQMAGVKDVFTSQRLALSSGMPGIRRIRDSFNQMRSGDIFVQVTPGWRTINEQTGEQSHERASYVGFPLFFFGSNVRPETVKTPVTVDCVAPTVARFMRIRAPNACESAPLAAVR